MKNHNKIAHLSQDQMCDLIDRYYCSNEKIVNLLAEFDIDVKPSKLVSLFPPIIHKELFCPYCENVNLNSKRQGRTTSSRYNPPPFCPECGHKNTDRCYCQNCREMADQLRYEAEAEKRQIIKREYGFDVYSPPVKEITLKDAVFLMTLERHSLTEDFMFVEPFQEAKPELAPTFEFKNHIVKHLYNKDLIRISPESPFDAFSFDASETHTDGYYPDSVLWEFLPGVNIENKSGYLKEIQSIVTGDGWPEAWNSDIPKLWHQIAKYECLEYFLYLLEQRDFELNNVGEKTHTVFEALLEDFPVSKVFNISWMAVRDTTDYIVRENIPRSRGRNTFIGAIQRKAERAKAEGWDIKHSRRDFNCPQTVVSSTFFNLFLNIGDKAFETMLPQVGEDIALAS